MIRGNLPISKKKFLDKAPMIIPLDFYLQLYNSNGGDFFQFKVEESPTKANFLINAKNYPQNFFYCLNIGILYNFIIYNN